MRKPEVTRVVFDQWKGKIIYTFDNGNQLVVDLQGDNAGKIIPTPTLAPSPTATAAEAPKATATPVDFWNDMATQKAWQAELVSADMAVKEHAVNEWLRNVSFSGFTPQEEARLRQVLGYLKYVPNNHDTSILPWVHPPYPYPSVSENPLHYLQRIRIIRKAYITQAAYGINGVDLNLEERIGYLSQETQELLWAASMMKEGSVLDWLKRGKGSTSPERVDLATVEAEVFTMQAFINAKNADGNFVLSDKVITELTRYKAARVDQMNQTAAAKGWQ